MKYDLRFSFEVDPPLTRNQQICLLQPFVDMLKGTASGRYHLRIDAESMRRTETLGCYDQEDDDAKD